MNWYYAVGGQQAGPVNETQFEALFQSGTILPTTLVWRDGMPGWQPCSEVRSATSATPSAAFPPIVANEVVCTECRQIFPRENTIQYGSVWVCAQCKPLFIQRLNQAPATPGMAGEAVLAGREYAGFWIRLAAKFVDGLILGVVLLIPMFFLGVSFLPQMGPTASPNAAVQQLGLLMMLQCGYVAVSLAYNTFFLGRYGATPGKMVCGLIVVSPDGVPITYARALGRSAGEILSGLICNIGYIIAGFDSEKRALHDHIASTRVVKK